MSNNIAYTTRHHIAKPDGIIDYEVLASEASGRVEDVVADVFGTVIGRQAAPDVTALGGVTVLNSPWGRVLNALGDRRWDFRTVQSIAQETLLEPSVVKTLLAEHESEVRRPMVPDRQGRELFTARDRQPGLREIVQTIQRYVSKSL